MGNFRNKAAVVVAAAVAAGVLASCTGNSGTPVKATSESATEATSITTSTVESDDELAYKYVARVNAQVKEELTAKAKKADAANAAATSAQDKAIQEGVAALSAALESGDVDALDNAITPDLRELIERAGTLDAWKGAGSGNIKMTAPKAETVPAQQVPDFDPVPGAENPADGSWKDNFGDTEYVPSINGNPWTDYEFDTYSEKESIEVSWHLVNDDSDVANSRCTVFTLTDGKYLADVPNEQNGGYGICDRGLFIAESVDMPTGFGGNDNAGHLTINSQPFTDVTAIQDSGSTGLLVGSYQVGVDESLSKLVKVKDGDKGVAIADVAPVLVPSDELLGKSKSHIQKWIDVQMKMVKDDDRCNYGWGMGSIKIDGVSVDTGWACDYYYRPKKLVTDNLEGNATVSLEDADYETDIAVTFTAAGDNPVIEVRLSSDGDKDQAWVARSVSANYVLEDGKLVYPDEKSVTYETN